MRGPVSYEATKEGALKRRQDDDDTSNLDSWHVIQTCNVYVFFAIFTFDIPINLVSTR